MSEESSKPAYLPWVIALALAYYAVGRLTLLLVIPPSSMTAVWPAAGIAVAILLVGGNRLWPGVFAGALAINASVYTDLPLGSHDANVIIATLSGGMAAQAVAAASFIRRYTGFPNPMNRERHIVLFLFFAGPVGCLVAPTVGVMTLHHIGLVEGHDVLVRWGAWWFADGVGAVIFAPLTLILISRPRSHWRPRILSVGLPLLLSFAVSVGFFVYASDRELDRLQANFERVSVDLYRSMELTIDAHLELSTALQSLFASVGNVSHTEFAHFTEPILKEHTGFQALLWIPRVSYKEREQVETAAKQIHGDFAFTEHVPDVGIRPAASRREYFPAYYVSPHGGNESVLGFDFGSNDACAKTIRKAQKSGRVASTGRLPALLPGDSRTVAVFLPVYVGSPGRKEIDRRQHLRGFVCGTLRIKDIIATAFKSTRDVELRVYDRSAPPGEQLMAVYPPSADRAPQMDGLAGLIRWNAIVSFGNRRWSLQFSPAPQSLPLERNWNAWFVLAGGMIMTSLLGAFLLVSAGRTETVRRMVAERTEQVSRANADLKQEIRNRIVIEEDLARRGTELAIANQELERFAYIASHDLKAPLRAVSGLSQWIEEDIGDALEGDSKEHFRLLRGRIRRMDGLLEGLLTYSRIGRVKAAIENVNVAVLVDEVEELLVPPEGQRIVRSGTLPTIQTAREPLEQVLRNLIANAYKHNGPSCRVTVACREQDAFYEFSVSDDGAGIAPEYHSRIFEIFQTLRPRDEVEGSGLGLALVKKTVEMFGGSVRVESSEGEGACFRFTWPKRWELAIEDG